MTYPMKYTIKKSRITEKLAFSGPCPVCAADLKLKEEEIGKHQTCPNCRATIRPVSAILKAYRLTESQKSLKDAVEVLTSEKHKIRTERDKLRYERNTVQRELESAEERLATFRKQYERAVSQVIDLQAEVALRDRDHDGNRIVQDDFLPDLNPEQPQVQPQAPYRIPHQYYPPKSAGGVSNGVAAAISFFFPGIGQMCQGRVGTGFAFFIGTCIGYALLIVPGLVLHGLSVLEAASYDPKN